MSLFGGRMTPELRRALALRAQIRSALDMAAELYASRLVGESLRNALRLVDEAIAEMEGKDHDA